MQAPLTCDCDGVVTGCTNNCAACDCDGMHHVHLFAEFFTRAFAFALAWACTCLIMQTLRGIGVHRSGAFLHQHHAAWNGLVHGRKRWLILTPGKLQGSQLPAGQVPAFEWFRDSSPLWRESLAGASPRCLQCTQRHATRGDAPVVL